MAQLMAKPGVFLPWRGVRCIKAVISSSLC